MRDASTDDMQELVNLLWGLFLGTKEDFMASLPGVTPDQRVEPAVNFDWQDPKDEKSYYCTMIRKDQYGQYRMFEVWSYDDGPWYCKS